MLDRLERKKWFELLSSGAQGFCQDVFRLLSRGGGAQLCENLFVSLVV